MMHSSEIEWRITVKEFIVAAPNNETFKIAFESLSPKAFFDSILKEWRIPKDGVDTEQLQHLLVSMSAPDPTQALDSHELGVSGELYGYACAEFGEGAEIQVDTLREMNIPDDQIFFDKLSGRYPQRPELSQCLEKLSSGDTVVVTNFNRLARSLSQLVETMENLQSKGAYIQSIEENIDTRNPEFQYFSKYLAFASEYEKKANSQRTKAGLEEAKAKGKRGGGRRTKMTREKIQRAIKLVIEDWKDQDIAKDLGVGRATIYRQIPYKASEIREIWKNEGQSGIDRIIEEATPKSLQGMMTDEIREEIMKLYRADMDVQWIADKLQFNRGTVRTVIEMAFKDVPASRHMPPQS
jgi:DNA invertase Pin-like site-specific DNA recombinase